MRSPLPARKTERNFLKTAMNQKDEKTNDMLQSFAAAALQGLLANPNLVNRENLHLESQEKISQTLRDIAFRALQAAIDLEEELTLSLKDREKSTK